MEVLFAVPASAELNGQVVRFHVNVAKSDGRKAAKSGQCIRRGEAGCFLNSIPS